MTEIIKITLKFVILVSIPFSITSCATTAANQHYDSPIPVYVDLTAPAKSSYTVTTSSNLTTQNLKK